MWQKKPDPIQQQILQELQHLRTDLNEFKAETAQQFAQVREETTQQFVQIREETAQQFTQVREETSSQMTDLRQDLVKEVEQWDQRFFDFSRDTANRANTLIASAAISVIVGMILFLLKSS